jgi:hypothetical protein
MKHGFTRLDQASGALIGGLKARRDPSILLAERWGELVGPYLVGKLSPRWRGVEGLEVEVLDARCRKSVEALLPQLEKRVKAAFPKIRRITLV